VLVEVAMSNLDTSKIFNKDYDYSQAPQLILGQDLGLMDTINKHYPEIWELMDRLRNLEWFEHDYDFTTCNIEFKTAPVEEYNAMINALSWQWEADTVAAKCIFALAAPFITDTSLHVYYTEKIRNENIHFLTYSEITRNSFDDPDKVLIDILSKHESLKRLDDITKVLAHVQKIGSLITLGAIDKDSDIAYEAFMDLVIVSYILESVQFMGSFAVTFALVKTGRYQEIGKAVSRIHSADGRIILNILRKSEKGERIFQNRKAYYIKLFKDVLITEKNWGEFALLSSDYKTPALEYLTPHGLFEYTLYCAKSVIEDLEITDELSEYKIPDENPLPFMEEYLNVDKQQGSPQEARNQLYILGNINYDQRSIDLVEFYNNI
jgi:ribonucleoside-diphosphate reductase beta chain